MDIKQSFGLALKSVRKSRNLTQEDFSNISSRTYLSALERGLYSPTIEKVDALAKAMGIHPLTLLSFSYLVENQNLNKEQLCEQISLELGKLISD